MAPRLWWCADRGPAMYRWRAVEEGEILDMLGPVLIKTSLLSTVCPGSDLPPMEVDTLISRIGSSVPIPDLMLDVQLVDRGTANSVRGTGAGSFRDQRPGSGIACSQDRGSPSCYTASPVTAKIDRLVLGGQVRRRPARSGGSGQRLLRAALRRARLF